MLFFPKNTKFKKNHSYMPQPYEVEGKKYEIVSGTLALKAMQSGHISAAQIESARKIIVRSLRKVSGSKLRICIFPFLALTRKPNEVRMGKGKGAPEGWVSTVKKGKILFELSGMTLKLGVSTLLHVKTKLALKSRLIIKD